MKLFTKITAGLLITGLLVTGCSLLGNNNSDNVSIQQTAVANTVIALQTSLAANSTPSETAPTATPEMSATATLAATVAPIATTVAAPTATSQPSYLITKVEDITAPDNTVYQPGESFTKTWRITNGGTASWSADFKLIFLSGDQMSAASVLLGRTVAPNQTIDISTNLVAPQTEGTYQGNFMIQTSDGKNFGLGSSGTSPFWVKIIVQKFFQVSSASVIAAPTSYSGVCPGTVSLSASITSTAAGTVTYYFVTSTGNSNSYTNVFTAAGTVTTAAISWSVPGPDPLVVHVYIDSPNHQDFSAVTIPVTCTP
jgi:hypothetical protein